MTQSLFGSSSPPPTSLSPAGWSYRYCIIVFASRIPPRLLQDQRPCGKELCSTSVEAVVCLNFGSLASYWPRLWSDFGVPLGAGRPPKGGPETSKRQPQTAQTASLECLWGAIGVRATRGGPGASGRQPRRPKMGLPPQRRAGLKKTPKNDEH